MSRVAAPVQGHRWGLGSSRLLLQLVQPLLHVTAAPAVHPPPVQLAGGLREVSEAEAAAAGEAGLLLGCRLLCCIGGRRWHRQGALAQIRLHRLKRTLFQLRRRTKCILPRPDGAQLATDARRTRRPPLAGCRSPEVHICQVSPSRQHLDF